MIQSLKKQTTSKCWVLIIFDGSRFLCVFSQVFRYFYTVFLWFWLHKKPTSQPGSVKKPSKNLEPSKKTTEPQISVVENKKSTCRNQLCKRLFHFLDSTRFLVASDMSSSRGTPRGMNTPWFARRTDRKWSQNNHDTTESYRLWNGKATPSEKTFFRSAHSKRIFEPMRGRKGRSFT